MIRNLIIGALALFLLSAPVHAANTSGSHYVHSYCRKNATCVRGHMSGNSHSGQHWHLNKDGSDTVTHPNGTHETVPYVASPK